MYYKEQCRKYRNGVIPVIVFIVNVAGNQQIERKSNSNVDAQIDKMVSERIKTTRHIIEVKGKKKKGPAGNDRSIIPGYPIQIEREGFDDKLFFQKMKIIVMKRYAEGIEIGEQACQREEEQNSSFADHGKMHSTLFNKLSIGTSPDSQSCLPL
jgi:hypothetical protein